jgi:hypothetical protein
VDAVMPDRSTEPTPERAYARLSNRIDRLEDTTNHFYNVLNELREVLKELRERVSTLERKPHDRADSRSLSRRNGHGAS